MDEKNVKAFSVFKRVFWLFSFFWATTKCEKPLLLNNDGDDYFVLEGAKDSICSYHTKLQWWRSD
jgi:hypothetical protein